MNIERLTHLNKYIDELEIDIENGLILNRSAYNVGKEKYLGIKLHSRMFKVHEVIAVAGGLDILDMTVDHLDFNIRNNRLDNLEPVTREENSRRNCGGWAKKRLYNEETRLKK